MHKSVAGLLFATLAFDASARFLSVDPVPANANAGTNINRYYYADDNPYKFVDPDGRAKSCANGQCVITADTFDPAKSNGANALASPDLRAAGKAAVPQFTVKSGSQESLGFFVPDANGKPVAQAAQGVTHGGSNAGTTAAGTPPSNAMGVIHGHIDGGPGKSNGMVDVPGLNRGYGDAESLKTKIPTATVSQGQVGWHEVNNGQLQFSYPRGALTRNQEKLIQRNLNEQQTLFHKKP